MCSHPLQNVPKWHKFVHPSNRAWLQMPWAIEIPLVICLEGAGSTVQLSAFKWLWAKIEIFCYLSCNLYDRNQAPAACTMDAVQADWERFMSCETQSYPDEWLDGKCWVADSNKSHASSRHDRALQQLRHSWLLRTVTPCWLQLWSTVAFRFLRLCREQMMWCGAREKQRMQKGALIGLELKVITCSNSILPILSRHPYILGLLSVIFALLALILSIISGIFILPRTHSTSFTRQQ